MLIKYIFWNHFKSLILHELTITTDQVWGHKKTMHSVNVLHSILIQMLLNYVCTDVWPLLPLIQNIFKGLQYVNLEAFAGKLDGRKGFGLWRQEKQNAFFSSFVVLFTSATRIPMHRRCIYKSIYKVQSKHKKKIKK